MDAEGCHSSKSRALHGIAAPSGVGQLPGQETNEPLADAHNADGNEDPALNEDGGQGLLVGHALGAIVSHHLHITAASDTI